jgi:site-specific recombinase XerD
MSLHRRIGDIELLQLTSEDVAHFINQPPASASTWRGKYFILQEFVLYLASRDAISEISMPAKRPAMRPLCAPYIFSQPEIRALLRATRLTQKTKSCIEGKTLRVLLFLVYATGSRAKELLDLRWEDVDLRRGFLVLGVGQRYRRIPIGSQVQSELRRYKRWLRVRGHLGRLLFATRDGAALNKTTIYHTFRRIRKAAGIRNESSLGRQPQMQDLRTTFAVHRISSWIRTGTDLGQMLPALAAYMGQAGLGSAETYLSLTPARFQRQLNMLSPQHKKGHWRNDRSLMRFLSSL